MKITKISFEKYSCKLLKPFVIAYDRIEVMANVLVRVDTDEGLVGYGEACHIPAVTGETPDGLITVLQLIGQQLIGFDPLNICGIHQCMDAITVGNPSAKAGIDIAVYDLAAKKMGVPLYQYLGGNIDRAETDFAIGIDSPEEMLGEARRLIGKGFKTIKVKIGKSVEKDIELISLFRKELGPIIRIRVDANQGYTVSEAIRVANDITKFNIDIFEQPIRSWDFDGLGYVRRRISIPLFADESMFSPHDAYKLAASHAVDGVNIKLMKCGGLYRALQIVAIAEAAGLEVIVGSMTENKVGITAATSLVASHPLINRANIESFMMVQENPDIRGGVTNQDGVNICPSLPGLGIDLNM